MANGQIAQKGMSLRDGKLVLTEPETLTHVYYNKIRTFKRSYVAGEYPCSFRSMSNGETWVIVSETASLDGAGLKEEYGLPLAEVDPNLALISKTKPKVPQAAPQP